MSRTQFCPKVRQPHLHRASMPTAAQLSCHCSNWRTHSSCLDGYRSPFSGLFFLSRSSSPICSPCTLCCLNASTLDELFSLGPSETYQHQSSPQPQVLFATFYLNLIWGFLPWSSYYRLFHLFYHCVCFCWFVPRTRRFCMSYSLYLHRVWNIA